MLRARESKIPQVLLAFQHCGRKQTVLPAAQPGFVLLIDEDTVGDIVFITGM